MAASERKTLTFRTSDGYFSLTDTDKSPDEETSDYFDVKDATYEDENLSLYFDEDERFQNVYDVVMFHWPMDAQVIDFLSDHLFTGTSLRLTLNSDGRNRMQ